MLRERMEDRPGTPIHRRETFMALIGLMVTRSVLPAHVEGLDLFVDNTTTESRLRKQYSPHAAENAAICKMLSAMGPLTWTVHWVPSGCMVADLDTR